MHCKIDGRSHSRDWQCLQQTIITRASLSAPSPHPFNSSPPPSFPARTTLTEYFLMGQQQLFSGSHIHSIPALCSSSSITTATTSSATSIALLLVVHSCNGHVFVPFLCFAIEVEVVQPVVASCKDVTSTLPYFAAVEVKVTVLLLSSKK